MTGSLRILLVDDHPVVRMGLRVLLNETEGMHVVAEAADGQAALDLLETTEVDLVLMDLQMGAGMDGVTATRKIAKLPDPPPVLVLTTYDTDADILSAVEAGATGYLLKDAPPEDLRAAIRTAALGKTVLAPEVANRLLGRLRTPAPDLTAREVEILTLLAGGLSNRALSRKLYISEATVKTHLVHIFGKLGVDNRTAAIAEATARGIIRAK